MNSVVIIGRVAVSPKLRTTRSGNVVCTLRVAIPGVDREGEERGATYVDVETSGSQARVIAACLNAGQTVAVAGRLRQKRWRVEGKRCEQVYVLADRAHGVELLITYGARDSAALDDVEPFASRRPGRASTRIADEGGRKPGL